MPKNHTSVTISWERYYGLRIFCAGKDPKIHSSQKVEKALKKEGIPKISKENYDKYFDKVSSGEIKSREVPTL